MFVSHLPQSSNCSSKQMYGPGLQVHHPLFQKIDWHPQVYCLKHCHVQKDQKDIILRDWEIPPRAPRFKSIHQTWDVFRWMNRQSQKCLLSTLSRTKKCWEMQSLTSVFLGNPTRIIITVLIGFLLGNPNLNHPSSTAYWEKHPKPLAPQAMRPFALHWRCHGLAPGWDFWEKTWR